jgi:hypothetical protein
MTDNAQSSQTRKPVTAQKPLLSHDLLHGLTPEEFNEQAKALARAEAMTPAVRARLKAQLIERLKTPVDRPSWGPDWVRHGERVAAPNHNKKSIAERLRGVFGGKKGDDENEDPKPPPLNEDETDDAQIIARNMEKSRQVSHYKPLYLGAAVLALAILLVAMFVDYHIIREVWTRALANEFMEVPKSLQSSVVFKSLQVIFAVLIVHFMLKITGVYGRNTMVAVAFVFAIVMIGGLGYLIAYSNLNGGTSTTLEQQNTTAPQTNSIDSLMASVGQAKPQPAALTTPAVQTASASDGVSIGLPKISRQSLADADSWFWLAFASVVFFIVTTVAALYMQITENNVRNYHIAHDYKHRQKQLAQLHLLELADQSGA